MLTKTKIYLSLPHMGDSEQKFVNEALNANWISFFVSNIEGFVKGLCLTSASYLMQNDLYRILNIITKTPSL
ncbi:hypothetical protein [Confluentibacter sediminis]|uniref:hypothetical protein n=1 Tax=Confluentibacter sediminis TaxID=2219045 RepID=UPI001C72EAB4|nr:hypothetical protein [Confluentibacter sediminis]